MFNSYPYTANLTPNYLPSMVGYRILPVNKTEEINNFFLDFQGNPLFFYVYSENSIVVKQRNSKTLQEQLLKYKLDETSIKAINEAEPTHNEVEELKAKISHLEALVVDKKKVKEEDGKQ